jgi:hypothetical protein
MVRPSPAGAQFISGSQISVVACLWCETRLSPGAKVCPECGLLSPAGEPKAALARHIPKGGRRCRRLGLALVFLVMPLVLSVAYAAHIDGLTLVSPVVMVAMAAPAIDALVPPAIYSDPMQREVWSGGVRAVEKLLAKPDSDDIDGSYVDVAAGNVVSFCGEVAGTSGYDSASGGQRFISVFGDAQSTTLEGNDPSFDVLWARVCSQNESPA